MRLQTALAIILSEDSGQQDVIGERKSITEVTDLYERGLARSYDVPGGAVPTVRTVELPEGCGFLFVRTRDAEVILNFTADSVPSQVTITPQPKTDVAAEAADTVDGIFMVTAKNISALTITNAGATEARVEVITAGYGPLAG